VIEVTDTITLYDNDLHFDFIRSAGPGGQNVNKVSTAVQLRYNVLRSPALSDEVKERLQRLAGKKITTDGVLIIEARRFRSQLKNRQDAIDRLVRLIRKASIPPTPRKKTRPPMAMKEKRLQSKKHRGRLKKLRSSADPPPE